MIECNSIPKQVFDYISDMAFECEGCGLPLDESIDKAVLILFLPCFSFSEFI